MEKGVNEKDWKLFRSRLPGWQETYMERIVEEYMELLGSEDQASEKFWALDERIRKDKRGWRIWTASVKNFRKSLHGL